MICIITGDIINSKKNNPKAWLKTLKKKLDKIGNTPKFWEIYSGDSFQVIISNPKDALDNRDKNKGCLKIYSGYKCTHGERNGKPNTQCYKLQ